MATEPSYLHRKVLLKNTFKNVPVLHVLYQSTFLWKEKSSFSLWLLILAIFTEKWFEKTHVKLCLFHMGYIKALFYEKIAWPSSHNSNFFILTTEIFFFHWKVIWNHTYKIHLFSWVIWKHFSVKLLRLSSHNENFSSYFHRKVLLNKTCKNVPVLHMLYQSTFLWK